MQPGSSFPTGDAQPYPPHNVGPFAAPVSGAGSPQASAGSQPDERGRRLRLGDLLAVVGGLALGLCSFAPFVSYSGTLVAQAVQSEDGGFTGEYTAWSAQMFMAPLTWFVVIAGLLVVVLAVTRVQTGRDPLILGAPASVVQVGLALFAFFVLLGYALSHKQTLFGLDSLTAGDGGVLFAERPALAWGGWLMLLGALFASVGAVLNHFNAGPTFRADTRRSRDRQRRNAGPGYPTPPVADGPPTS